MPKKKTKPKKAAADETFEQALARLETTVADLEEGDLGLAESLDRYEEAVGRLKACHAQLEAAERKIELLSGVDAEGNPVKQPFDASASADDPTAAGRSRKRSAKGGARSRSTDVDDPSRLF